MSEQEFGDTEGGRAERDNGASREQGEDSAAVISGIAEDLTRQTLRDAVGLPSDRPSTIESSPSQQAGAVTPHGGTEGGGGEGADEFDGGMGRSDDPYAHTAGFVSPLSHDYNDHHAVTHLSSGRMEFLKIPEHRLGDYPEFVFAELRAGRLLKNFETSEVTLRNRQKSTSASYALLPRNRTVEFGRQSITVTPNHVPPKKLPPAKGPFAHTKKSSSSLNGTGTGVSPRSAARQQRQGPQRVREKFVPLCPQHEPWEWRTMKVPQGRGTAGVTRGGQGTETGVTRGNHGKTSGLLRGALASSSASASSNVRTVKATRPGERERGRGQNAEAKGNPILSSSSARPATVNTTAKPPAVGEEPQSLNLPTAAPAPPPTRQGPPSGSSSGQQQVVRVFREDRGYDEDRVPPVQCEEDLQALLRRVAAKIELVNHYSSSKDQLMVWRARNKKTMERHLHQTGDSVGRSSVSLVVQNLSAYIAFSQCILPIERRCVLNTAFPSPQGIERTIRTAPAERLSLLSGLHETAFSKRNVKKRIGKVRAYADTLGAAGKAEYPLPAELCHTFQANW
uniref:Uncharacterized protein n=1 Tax=Chromera velia CCMP2878 TaxID=1169474 RepID=A0A0G4HUA8_9ALVE|eukprot:Cvel_1373.t1-p1 / transcript=Cvel_1373.t1 / gene=Cvel_1373 / organism=Chromera_velia_CCMP2878 / gene_product=hypothetical protein / transcript_product=hypothetical protein / location=Cvel_scaffold47:120486-122976(-) / protein_length=564 / sequence_SO=supercontig / SO=protein_coding / is_pseudo=false